MGKKTWEFKNMLGLRFGKLIVIDYIGKVGSVHKWLCECECGGKKEVSTGHLNTGNTNHCGCESKHNLLGKKFNKLKVIKKLDSRMHTGHIRQFWLCECDCGNIKEMHTTQVKNNISCGCSFGEGNIVEEDIFREDIKQFGYKLISNYKGRSKAGRVKCIYCGDEREYASLIAVYKKPLCKCRKYDQYKLENSKDLLNKLEKQSSLNLIEEKEELIKKINNRTIDGKIYKSTNQINGKIYIGITIQHIEQRISQHVSDAKHGSKLVFHSAIRKYGKENFTWEVIDNAYTEEELKRKEIFWIDKYESCILNKMNKGYNMTFGGDDTTHLEGENNSRSKLSNDDVELIRLIFVTEEINYVEIAKMFKIGYSAIRRILRGETYRNLRPDLIELCNIKINAKKYPKYIKIWKMRYVDGMTDEEISESEKYSTKEIQTYISAANFKIGLRKKRKNLMEQQTQREEIVSLYQDKKMMPIEIIKMGYPSTTVRRIIKNIS